MTSASILSRLRWTLRDILRRRPHDAAEEVWRLRELTRCRPRTPGTVTWHGAPLHYCDGPAVLGQLREIFVHGIYDFTTAEPAPRILDGGAHVGLATLRWRELFPTAEIIAFEADPAIAARLRRNLEARGDLQTQVVEAALWIADGSVGFECTGMDNGHVSSSAGVTVPAHDIARYCSRPVDLLKLDVEGAEARVISHLCDQKLLSQVRRLVCEWHQWTTGTPLLHEALAKLAAAGFNYRIHGADCFGASGSPGFPRVPWPANHVVFHAWRADATA